MCKCILWFFGGFVFNFLAIFFAFPFFFVYTLLHFLKLGCGTSSIMARLRWAVWIAIAILCVSCVSCKSTRSTTFCAVNKCANGGYCGN